MTAPERSLAQRRAALRNANDVRTRRARLKADLKAGCESVHRVLLEPPEWVETMKVWDLLLAVPKYGRVKVNTTLRDVRISPSKTVGGMSERQRADLVARLRNPNGAVEGAAAHHARVQQAYRDAGHARANAAYRARLAQRRAMPALR